METIKALQDLRRLIVKLLLFGVALLALNFVFKLGMDRLVSHWKLDNGLRIGILNKAHPDIVILGGSRAICHYDPAIITAKTGMTTCNFGNQAVSSPYNLALFSMILREEKPAVAVYEVSRLDLYKAPHTGPNSYLSLLRPYYGRTPECNEVLNYVCPGFQLRALFGAYLYNGSFLQFLRSHGSDKTNLMGFNPVLESHVLQLRDVMLAKTHGIPAHQLYPDPLPADYSDQFNYHCLMQLIGLAKENHVKLIFVQSPMYHPDQYSNEWYYHTETKEVAQIAKEEGIPFVRITTEAHREFDNPALFMDFVHLNTQGAEMFSNLVADSLNKVIQQ